MSENAHPVFLTGEDGEPIWIKAGVFANHKEALAAYNNEHGSEWRLDTPPSDDPVPMLLVGAKESPWGDDPVWHRQVTAPGPDTVLYWRFDA